MVASQKEEIIREFNFVCKEQTNGFDTLLSTIDVISNEKELLVATRVPSYFKESEQVEVLSVDVSEYLDGCFDIEQHLFFCEYFGAFVN